VHRRAGAQRGVPTGRVVDLVERGQRPVQRRRRLVQPAQVPQHDAEVVLEIALAAPVGLVAEQREGGLEALARLVDLADEAQHAPEPVDRVRLPAAIPSSWNSAPERRKRSTAAP
jgi:hypothetical protein